MLLKYIQVHPSPVTPSSPQLLCPCSPQEDAATRKTYSLHPGRNSARGWEEDLQNLLLASGKVFCQRMRGGSLTCMQNLCFWQWNIFSGYMKETKFDLIWSAKHVNSWQGFCCSGTAFYKKKDDKLVFFILRMFHVFTIF